MGKLIQAAAGMFKAGSQDFIVVILKFLVLVLVKHLKLVGSEITIGFYQHAIAIVLVCLRGEILFWIVSPFFGNKLTITAVPVFFQHVSIWNIWYTFF